MIPEQHRQVSTAGACGAFRCSTLNTQVDVSYRCLRAASTSPRPPVVKRDVSTSVPESEDYLSCVQIHEVFMIS